MADSATNGPIGLARFAFHTNDVVKRAAVGAVESVGTVFSHNRSENSGHRQSQRSRSLHTIGTAGFPSAGRRPQSEFAGVGEDLSAVALDVVVESDTGRATLEELAQPALTLGQ